MRLAGPTDLAPRRRHPDRDSPADKAGVEAGDVIVRFDGKAIDKVADLPRLVGNTKPGTKSTLTVFRRGSLRDLHLTIAQVQPDEKVASTGAKSSSAAAQQWGLTVADLSATQKKDLKLKGGVRVVAAAEAAARAGLREDDIILALANTEIATLKDFEAVLAKVDKTKPVNVLVRRGDWAQYVLIRPER